MGFPISRRKIPIPWDFFKNSGIQIPKKNPWNWKIPGFPGNPKKSKEMKKIFKNEKWQPQKSQDVSFGISFWEKKPTDQLIVNILIVTCANKRNSIDSWRVSLQGPGLCPSRNICHVDNVMLGHGQNFSRRKKVRTLWGNPEWNRSPSFERISVNNL